MKKFLLKTLDVVLTIVMIVSSLYAIFNIVMSFLPVDIQTRVYGLLHMSQEYIATFSISATFNAIILVASKLSSNYLRSSLISKLTKAEKVIQQDAAVNQAVIEGVNKVVNNLNILQTITNAVLSVQKVTTERNIKASEKLVHDADKEAYKQALEQIKSAQAELSNIQNITAVYEKTEVKEVIVEKEVDEYSGRV